MQAPVLIPLPTSIDLDTLIAASLTSGVSLGHTKPFVLASQARATTGFSYGGLDPVYTVEIFPQKIVLKNNSGQTIEETCENFFDWMKALIPQQQSAAGQKHFSSGWVGFLGYEMAPLADPHLPKRPLAEDTLIGWFGLYDPIWIWDHGEQRGYTASWGWELKNAGSTRLAEKRGNQLVYDLTRRIEWILAQKCNTERGSKLIYEPLSEPLIDSSTILQNGRFPVSTNPSFTDYLKAVGSIKNYIHAGDCYQVNLTQELCAEVPAMDLKELQNLFCALLKKYPASFSAYLHCDTLQILSVSPEEFLTISGDRIQTRPIKGTRRRGKNLEEDKLLQEELIGSPKDRAELLMIVDLERNDLGKICKTGTVQTPIAGELETHPYVHHLAATITGELLEGTHPLEAVRALFPGGSITGAPKKRAMEIIDELEKRPRGVYTGAIGFFDYAPLAALSIAIRTFTRQGSKIKFGAGSGIVAESDPFLEYNESLTKAEALFYVLQSLSVRSVFR